MSETSKSHQDNLWRDRVYCVTGGASGIGLATTLTLARAGAHVVIGDRNTDLGEEVVRTAGADGLALRFVPLDVTEPASAEALVAAALADYGRLDGMVCSAGITEATPALDITPELWERVIAVNLTGTFLCVRAAAMAMIQGGRPGSMVTVASGRAFTGGKGMAHYAASKAGVVALTKVLAIEFAEHGIRVNCVAPGAVDTPLFRAQTFSGSVATGSRSPLGRIGDPQDLANSILYLLSDHASYTTGQTIHVNGGSYMAS